MIEIVWIDKKDFINQFLHFDEHEGEEIYKFIKDGIEDPATHIIKVKKWKEKVQSSGK